MNTTTPEIPVAKRDSSTLPRSMDACLLRAITRRSTRAEELAYLKLELQNYVGRAVSSHFIKKPYSLLSGHLGVVTETKEPGDGTIVWVTNILCHDDGKPLEIVIHVSDYFARLKKGRQFRDRESTSALMCEARVRVHH